MVHSICRKITFCVCSDFKMLILAGNELKHSTLVLFDFFLSYISGSAWPIQKPVLDILAHA